MLDFINRGCYIGAVCCFIAVGFILVLVGNPEYLKPLVSEGIYNAVYNTETPKVSTVTVGVGAIIVIFSTVVGAAGGLLCRFSKKHIKPKNVDVLRAQNVSVFLVDGEIYKKGEASFYNLEDLDRIRVTLIRNLYYVELERDITIAPKGNADEKNTASDRDSETKEQGSGSDNEEGSGKRFTA